MSAPLLEVRGVGKDYPVKGRQTAGVKSKLVAVDRVSLSLRSGEILGLAGESGCGKSTLAKLICRLEEPTRGEIIFKGQHLEALAGEKLRRLRHQFQPVFQDPLGSLNPRFTLRETLAEPLRLLEKLAGDNSSVYPMNDLLEMVGLGRELLERYPHQLSGGQRQRLGIARALAAQPELVVADEPLSSLDVSIQAQILNLIQDLQRRLGISMLFISHDLRAVGHISDRILIMYLGRCMECAPANELFARARHPYTRALFQALPRLEAGRGRRRAILKGELPVPINPEPGCRFFSRCEYRQEACLAYENELLPVGEGHQVACRRWEEL